MNTENTEILEAINKVVEANTFSLKAAENIGALRIELAAKNSKLEIAEHESERLKQEKIALQNQLAASTATINQYKAAESAIAAREKAVIEHEKSVAVAKGQVDVFRECFGLVFRNTEIRRSMLGIAPTSANANPSQYTSPTVSVSEDQTETRT